MLTGLNIMNEFLDKPKSNLKLSIFLSTLSALLSLELIETLKGLSN